MRMGNVIRVVSLGFLLISTSGCIKGISLEPSSAALPCTAGSFQLRAETFIYNDVAWTVEVVEGADWLSIAGPATGNSPGRVNVAYAANPSTEERTGRIRIFTTDNRIEDKEELAEITQAGCPEEDEEPIVGFAEFYIFDQNIGGEGQIAIVTGSGASFFSGCFDVLFPDGDFLPELEEVEIIPDQVGTPPFDTLPNPVPGFEPCVEAQDPGPSGQFSSGANMLGFVENGAGNFRQETGIATGFEYGTPLSLSFPGGADIGPFNLDLRIPVQPVFILPVVAPGPVFNDFDYNPAADLPITWETSEATRGAFVTITLVANTFVAGGPIHFGQLYVATADDGAFTYTAEQLAQLPAPEEGDTLLVTLRLNRYMLFDSTVPLTAGTMGRMGVFTTASARADFQSN